MLAGTRNEGQKNRWCHGPWGTRARRPEMQCTLSGQELGQFIQTRCTSGFLKTISVPSTTEHWPIWLQGRVAGEESAEDTGECLTMPDGTQELRRKRTGLPVSGIQRHSLKGRRRERSGGPISWCGVPRDANLQFPSASLVLIEFFATPEPLRSALWVGDPQPVLRDSQTTSGTQRR